MHNSTYIFNDIDMCKNIFSNFVMVIDFEKSSEQFTEAVRAWNKWSKNKDK